MFCIEIKIFDLCAISIGFDFSFGIFKMNIVGVPIVIDILFVSYDERNQENIR
jgi:hypothetical protein